LKKYFDSINKDLVEAKFKFILSRMPAGYKKLFLETIINKDTGGIYQGSPLSGMISNYVSRYFIVLLNRILNTYQETYQHYIATIYADDITISSDKKINKKYVYSAILNVIERLGLPFKINFKKTRLFSKQKRKALGYRINNKNQVIKPKSYLNKINFRVTIHKLAIGELNPKKVFTREYIGKLNEVFKSEREKSLEESSLKRYIAKFNDKSKYKYSIEKMFKKYGVAYNEKV
jgi:hypothetical protein